MTREHTPKPGCPCEWVTDGRCMFEEDTCTPTCHLDWEAENHKAPAQPDPADELRAAAQHVRALSAAAGPGPWKDVPDVLTGGWAVARHNAGPEGPYLANFTRTEHAQWIALMHPGVGNVLAAWLDTAADYYRPGVTHQTHVVLALAVARALLGGQP